MSSLNFIEENNEHSICTNFCKIVHVNINYDYIIFAHEFAFAFIRQKCILETVIVEDLEISGGKWEIILFFLNDKKGGTNNNTGSICCHQKDAHSPTSNMCIFKQHCRRCHTVQFFVQLVLQWHCSETYLATAENAAR